jgi:sugar phosphate isomerase/epimerase
MLALNQNSCDHKDLISFIEYSKDFQDVELEFYNIESLISENAQFTAKDLSEYLEMYDLKLVNLLRLEDFSLCSDTKFKNEIIPTLKKMMNLCYKTGCYLITVSPSFESRDIPQWRITRRTREKLKELAKIAHREDIKLGFEFSSLPDSSIPSLSETKKVLKPLISQENVGYIIDTFYLANNETGIEDLKDIMNQIFLIQLGDINPLIESDALELEEKHRIFPGKGKFDFQGLFLLTKEKWYRDFFSLELYHKKCEKNYYSQFFNLNQID